MDIHIGVSTIIAIAWPLSLVAMFFVAAAYGKRIGMKGGTIKGSTIHAAQRSTDKSIARIESMLKTVMDKQDK